MCKNDVFVAKICNCKIRCFLSRKFANARSALALRDIWRSPLARQLIAAWTRGKFATIREQSQYVSHMTSSQINDTFLFHRVLKILTGGRILQISIAWCQIEAEIRSFPTMYGKGGGICGKNWRNKGFRPKVMPKTRFF